MCKSSIMFNSLSWDDKMYLLWFESTYLLTRLQGDYKIKLYYLNGFYVELYYNTVRYEIDNAIATSNKHVTDRYLDVIEVHNI